MTRHALGFLTAIFLASLMAVACENEPEFRPTCASDEECVEKNGRPDWYCSKERGRCACRSDNACDLQEHCEPLPGGDGYCHPNRICEWNDDCDPGEFCDIATSICRRSGCSLDVQCRHGEVCDLLTSTCVPGCRSHGDCGYREVCLCEDGEGIDACVCDAETEEGRRACQVGTCVSNTCTEDSHCDWGQICVDNPDPDNPLKVCVNDPRGPFCDHCDAPAGGANDSCQGASNYCLMDASGDTPRFCGVTCSRGESCPNGFVCADVLVLTEATCGSDAHCMPPPTAPSCETDDDCVAPAGRCVDGKCAGYCRGREGDKSGWCSCVTDEQCPTQSCVGGFCTLSGTQCVTDEQCQGEIVCHVGANNIGYCKIGQNCAPQEGVNCSEVRIIRGVH